MSSNDAVSSIADASRPNAGRIYDYLLGGNHNFEIDRQAAQQLLQIVPEVPLLLRLIRWFLGEAVRRLVDQGFIHFLDFASGLPTIDHIHQIAPKGTKVIYSDIDSVTVEYGKEIISDLDGVAFVQCDAGAPESLLESEVINQILGSQRKLAIGMNGIAWFLPDDELAHAFEVLYDCAEEGSMLFVSDGDTERITSSTENVLEFYKNVGQPVHTRSFNQLQQILGRWKVEDPGFLPLNEWVDIDPKLLDSPRKKIVGSQLVGAILSK
jgi:hypothetical protein